jgi:transcriptional regulator with XRE-family HTH domain
MTSGAKKISKEVEVGIMEVDARHFLAQHVYFRREAMQLTQVELADRMGTTQAQVANLEAGYVNPTLRTLVKLAHALKCAGVHELLAPTDEESDVTAEDTWDAEYVRELAAWNPQTLAKAPRLAVEERQFRLVTHDDDDWAASGIENLRMAASA